MTFEIRRQIVLHAIRWASNIIIEATSNHASIVNPLARNKLQEAIAALADAEERIRRA